MVLYAPPLGCVPMNPLNAHGSEAHAGDSGFNDFGLMVTTIWKELPEVRNFVGRKILMARQQMRMNASQCKIRAVELDANETTLSLHGMEMRVSELIVSVRNI